MVLPLIDATNPVRWVSAANSLMLQRASGRPVRAGSSQARALTVTMTSGGKSPGPPRACLILQPRKAFVKKALSPERHDFAARPQAAGDRVIRSAFGREQNHLRAEHLEVRARVF